MASAIAVAAVVSAVAIAVVSGFDSEAASSSPYCNPALVNHTYNLSRFATLSPSCRAVTGVVKRTASELDGDVHIAMAPDPGQSGLYPLENGHLVIEVICKATPRKLAAKKACGSYRSPIKIPAVGSHIRAVGRFVKDIPPNHVELHPITSITILSGRAVKHLPAMDTHPEENV